MSQSTGLLMLYAIPWLAGGVKLVIQIERVLVFFINLVFIFASIYFALIEFISAIRHKPSPLPIRHTHPIPVCLFMDVAGQYLDCLHPANPARPWR